MKIHATRPMTCGSESNFSNRFIDSLVPHSEILWDFTLQGSANERTPGCVKRANAGRRHMGPLIIQPRTHLIVHNCMTSLQTLISNKGVPMKYGLLSDHYNAPQRSHLMAPIPLLTSDVLDREQPSYQSHSPSLSLLFSLTDERRFCVCSGR